MVCLKCGSTSLTYDKLANMYFCKSCNKLYNDKEVDFNKCDELKETKELGGFTLTALNLVQSIPLVGIIVPYIITKSNVSNSYKRLFSYRFISQFILTIIIVVALSICYLNLGKDISSAIQYSHSMIVNSVKDTYIKKSDVLSPTAKSKAKIDKPVVDSLSTLDSDNLIAFDGVVINGKAARTLIDYSGNSLYACLLQTKSIEERYGKYCYKNYGYRLSEAYADTVHENYYVQCNKYYDFYKDNAGNYVELGLDGIDDDKYIYYVNPASLYRFNVALDRDCNVIGYIFTEVDSK